MNSNLYNLFQECHHVVCTDTRKIIPNSLFFALKGENFNGNQFATAALESGAKYAVIDEEEYLIDEKTILVSDVLKSLQSLANEYRLTLNIPIIGITGSNGKTTSKELIGRVLSRKYRVHVTPGNFNNHIGLPLTILSAPPNSEMLLLEMGDNHPGEINHLCEIADPTHGLITNVGKDHIEGFGSFEANRLAKKELFDYLNAHGGICFVPKFESDVVKMVPPRAKKISLGNELKPELSNPFVRYSNASKKIITTHFIGDYNFKNIEMAYSIGKHFKVDEQLIHEAIASYTPQNNRSQFIETKTNSIFLDAYNANPSSVDLALQSFAKQKLKVHRIAILGDMLELGNVSNEEHERIIEQVNQTSITPYFVGKEYGKLAHPKKGKFFLDRFELIEFLKNSPITNSQVLIKGSRGIRLEEVLAYL